MEYQEKIRMIDMALERALVILEKDAMRRQCELRELAAHLKEELEATFSLDLVASVTSAIDKGGAVKVYHGVKTFNDYQVGPTISMPERSDASWHDVPTAFTGRNIIPVCKEGKYKVTVIVEPEK